MITNHDRWSKLGEKNLGEANIRWAKKMEEMHVGYGELWGYGPMMLMKAIMNDYWADALPGSIKNGWDGEKVDVVMSKLYWCWVAWLECTHPLGDEEE